MTPHPHGLEGLAETIRVTQSLMTQANDYSLVDAVFSEQDGQIILDRLREWIGGSLTDFINEYASGLTESIYCLIASGDLVDADVVAAQALPELAEQLCFICNSRPGTDHGESMPSDCELAAAA